MPFRNGIAPVCTAVLLATLQANLVHANMAPPKPDLAGSSTGELGGVKQVAIERETLTLDLRPLASAAPALVEAVYHLRKEGVSEEFDLVFVSGTPLAEGAVTLDSQPVKIRRTGTTTLPESWRFPATTPALEAGVEPLPYRSSLTDSAGTSRGTIPQGHTELLFFSVLLTPGTHELTVRYEAFATARQLSSCPRRVWQFAYILAPARDWASFGQLDVSVQLPSGWQWASAPVLQQSGDQLSGSFAGLPADALALTLQAPSETAAYWSGTALWIIYLAICLIGVPWLCWRLGAALGSRLAARGRSAWLALPINVLLAAGWAALLVGALFVWSAAAREWNIPESQLSANYVDSRLGTGMAGALLILSAVAIGVFVVIPVGTLLAQSSAVRANRRACRQATV